MEDVIKYWEDKDFRICIFPTKECKKWYWRAGVYVGNSTRAEWVDSNNNLSYSLYNTYKEALDAVVNYCNNYGKRKKERS